MLKLSEYNNKIRKEIEKEDRKMVFCDVACDVCGEELKYKNYNIMLLSYPAKKQVVCPNCGREGYIYCKEE